MSEKTADDSRANPMFVDGDLDTSFGVGGKVMTQFSGFDAAYDTILQPDGKVVVAGETNGHFTVARYVSDGSLDPSFGVGGIHIVDSPRWDPYGLYGADGELMTLARQADGKILLGGSVAAAAPYYTGFGVFRFNTDGTPDTAFGTGGLVTTTFDYQTTFPAASLRDIAVQMDGKIVAVGGAGDGTYFFIARYNTDGSLDTGFGTGGKVIVNYMVEARAVAIQADGKIVVAGGGSFRSDQGAAGAVVRFLSNGSLDGSFGSGGKVDTFYFNRDVIQQADGKIVLAGDSGETPERANIARLNSDGTADFGFHSSGNIIIDAGGFSSFTHVVQQADGKLVAAGSKQVATGRDDFIASRVDTSGNLDPAFGTGGTAVTDFNGFRDDCNGLALQADGKLVVAGLVTGTATGRDIGLARLMTNGSLDPGFGTGGKVETPLSQATPGFTDVALQPDGKIVAGGAYGEAFTLARYNADGTLDATFGTGGILTTEFDDLFTAIGHSNGNGELFDFKVALAAVAVQADGKIVAAGSAGNGQNFVFDKYFLLARYNSDGSLDATFHAEGEVATFFNGGLSNCENTEEGTKDMVLQPDGKIVFADWARYFCSDDRSELRRYNADGTPDQNFGVSIPIDTVDMHSILRLPGGGFSGVGGKTWLGDSDLTIARFTGNGRLDTTFGMNGVTPTDFGGIDYALGQSMRSDGRILAGGYTSVNLASPSRIILAQFMDSGSLDPNYGTGGKVITDFGGYTQKATSVAELANGKTIVAGTYSQTSNQTDQDYMVLRYNADGSLDPTFGTGGKVTTDFSGGADSLYSIAVQPDGRVVAAGIPGLARYLNSSGPAPTPSPSPTPTPTVTPTPTPTNCYPPPSNVVVWYPGDGNTNDLGPGHLNGTITGGVTYSAGEVAQGFNFNGTDGKVAVADDPSLSVTGDLTIEGWIDPAAIGSSQVIVAKDTDIAHVTYILSLTGSGHLNFIAGNNALSDGTISPNTFTHVAVTRSGQTISFYINGVLSNSGTVATTSVVNTARLTIGATDNSLIPPFNGIIDELTIYNRALSASEIQSIAQAAGFGKCKPPTPTPTPGVPTPTPTPTPSPTPLLCTTMAAWYKFEGNANDAIGGNNGATTAVTYAAAEVNQGVQVTTASTIRVPNAAALRPPNSISIEGWVKADSPPGTSRFLIGKADSASGSYALETGSNSGLEFLVRRAIGVSPYITSPNAGPGIWNGQLHHVAGTYTGTFVRLYVDGAEVGTGTPHSCASCLISYDTTQDNGDLFIGRLNTFAGSNFAGTLDELTIYPRELTPAEIQSIFNAGHAGKCTTAAPRTPFDFDGDGRADIALFRGSDATWYRLNSGNNSFATVPWGAGSDTLVPADYDGDGKTDHAIFRSGQWWVLQSSNGQVSTLPFGQAGDIPRPGDFDGDGSADIAVFRPSTGTWWRRNSSNGQIVATQFGLSGDVPMLGDFDGDGKTDIAVFRPSNGVWYVLRSSDGQVKIDQFGLNGDIPLNGDFNGDGKADLAVFRPSDRTWYVARATGVPAQNFDATVFGLSTDVPVPADYDGDGKADIAVFRSGQWWVLRSSSGQAVLTPFGLGSDGPVEAN